MAVCSPDGTAERGRQLSGSLAVASPVGSIESLFIQLWRRSTAGRSVPHIKSIMHNPELFLSLVKVQTMANFSLGELLPVFITVFFLVRIRWLRIF